MTDDVQARISAGIFTALDRCIPSFPSTPAIIAFEHRYDRDPGFQQYLQREIVNGPAFRSHRDLIAYRCLKTILFPRGATFPDGYETADYSERQAFRIEQSARKAGLLEDKGRARRDGRYKIWKSPFIADEPAINDLIEAQAMINEYRAEGSPLTPVRVRFMMLYGVMPFHEMLAKETEPAYADAILAGFARALQLEFTLDWRHKRTLFHRWLTHLQHKPAIDKQAWEELHRGAKVGPLAAGLVQKVTMALLTNWFAELTPDNQQDILNTSATLEVTPKEAAEAFHIRADPRDPDPVLPLLTIQAVTALHLLGQTEAAIATAHAAAETSHQSAGIAQLHAGHILYWIGRRPEAAQRFDYARKSFHAREAHFMEAISELWLSVAQVDFDQRELAREHATKLSALLTEPAEKFCYHTHSSLMAAFEEDAEREKKHLLEALKTDALRVGDYDLYNQVHGRLSTLEDKKTRR